MVLNLGFIATKDLKRRSIIGIAHGFCVQMKIAAGAKFGLH